MSEISDLFEKKQNLLNFIQGVGAARNGKATPALLHEV